MDGVIVFTLFEERKVNAKFVWRGIVSPPSGTKAP